MTSEHKEVIEHFLFFSILIVFFVATVSGGEAEWLMQGETVKVAIDGTVHEITLLDSTDTACALMVDGQVVMYGALSKHVVNSVQIHILEADRDGGGFCKIVLPGKMVYDSKVEEEEVEIVEDLQDDVISVQTAEALVETLPVEEQPAQFMEARKVSKWSSFVSWFLGRSEL